MTGNILKEIIVFCIVFFILSSLLLFLRRLILDSLYRWAKTTESGVDNIILDSVRHPSIYWAFAIGLYTALGTSGFPQAYVGYGLKAIYILIILSVTIVLANVASKLIHRSIERAKVDIPPGLSRTIINVFIFVIGFLIILNDLGISITPLLTALGVGGLAVALALQDTLSNLFAGLHIMFEKPLKVGDYVKLDTGEEGYVVDIGWRTTRIRKLQNNVVVIPNSKLAQAVITNFYMPEKRMSLLIPIGVSYDDDPERVEEILIEEVKNAVGSIPGLRADPPPFVRFIPGFGDFSLDFTLICQVEEYVDQYLVQHELRKRIFKRFKKEGIEIPFPIRTVYLKR